MGRKSVEVGVINFDKFCTLGLGVGVPPKGRVEVGGEVFHTYKVFIFNPGPQ